MADPLSAVASAITVIAAAASLCETAHSLISSVRSIPHQITRLGYELQSTATVLHTLNHILCAEHEDTQHVETARKQQMVNHIHELVVHTKRAIEDAAALLEPFTVRRGEGNRLGTLKAFMWEVTKKEEVSALSRTLGSYKSTLSLACSSLAIFNDSHTHHMVHSLQLDVSTFLNALRHGSNEKSKAGWSPEEHGSSQLMRAATKYKPPLRRFLERTNSVISRSSDGRDFDFSPSTRSRTDSMMSMDQRLSHRCLSPQPISPCCDSGQQEAPPPSGRLIDVHTKMPVLAELDSFPLAAELEGESASPGTQYSTCTSAELPAFSAPSELEGCSVACCNGCIDAETSIAESNLYDEVSTSIAHSRPSSAYSFETDREDILVLAENRDCDQEFMHYLSRMSPDSWSEYPNDEVLTLRRQLSSRYHRHGNSSTATNGKREKPKIRVTIPNRQPACNAITELHVGEDDISEQTSDCSMSARTSPPESRRNSILPTLDLGELNLSPLPPNTNETSASTNTSPKTLPELDFGPEFSPRDSASPWSPDSPSDDTAELSFRSTGTVRIPDGKCVLPSGCGKSFMTVHDEAFMRFDALSPLAVERLL